MAYAAITSLMSTIKYAMECPGIHTLQSFYEKLETLRTNLETPCNITNYDHEVMTSLEAEIIELACSAEDMVETESRKLLRAENTLPRRLVFTKIRFLLKRAVARIESSMNKLMALRIGDNNSQDLIKKAQNLTLDSTPERALEPESKMVGLENEFEILKDQLSRGAFELEVVSIVGMGGIGKTTLATKLYSDPFMMSRFDIRAKTTVSGEYCARNVLLDLLSSTSGNTDEFCVLDAGQLADRLQKLLKGRRYLVVIDDIWNTEAWDDIKLCFPECNNGSRILMTTRNVEVAEYASSGNPPYQMRLMNFEESWSLLYERVFVNECFSPEFEKIGKQIALNCKGLPLTIIVIAGLLSNIGKSLDEWKSIVENITSNVSTDLDVQCMRVLALSYHRLPHHLKACFVYLAIFPEDRSIFVNTLVRLWAAEGFLKIDEAKRIEEVGRKCLKELIDRSLVFIKHLSFDGKIKACGMHDVIRELCLREARHTNFVSFIGGKNHQDPNARDGASRATGRGRISIQSSISRYATNKLANCRDNKARSILFFGCFSYKVVQEMKHFKLLRVLDLASVLVTSFVPNGICNLFHLRYLALTVYSDLSKVAIPKSIAWLHYLQSLILKFPYSERGTCCFRLPADIFKMQELRHLCLDWNYLSSFEPGERYFGLKHIQCISGWNPLCCRSSILRLLPNLKKLEICGCKPDYAHSNKDNVLHGLSYLNQLEKLKFRLKKLPYRAFSPERTNSFPPLVLPPPAAFPQNLKKLAFSGDFSLQWKDLSIVGKLPKLESLKLACGACDGPVWEVVEEGFPHLKFLLLKDMHIKYWRASSDHFPCLERLFLERCRYLDSIPQDFEGITTLQLIDISFCAESVGNSAKQIQQDIEDNYGTNIEVRIS